MNDLSIVRPKLNKLTATIYIMCIEMMYSFCPLSNSNTQLFIIALNQWTKSMPHNDEYTFINIVFTAADQNHDIVNSLIRNISFFIFVLSFTNMNHVQRHAIFEYQCHCVKQTDDYKYTRPKQSITIVKLSVDCHGGQLREYCTKRNRNVGPRRTGPEKDQTAHHIGNSCGFNMVSYRLYYTFTIESITTGRVNEFMG